MLIPRRNLLAVLLACALGVATPAAAEWLVAFQAVPADDDPSHYTARAILTTELVAELGPPALAAIGLDPANFDVDVAPGGYQGKTNPSVLLHLDADGATADRAAAAFGFVFGQQSVLVWRDAGVEPPGTLAVSVEFPSMTANLADYFFRHAAAVNPGLAAGFTARDRRLVFINLRGADARPALDDDVFLAALRRAAETFGGLKVSSSRVQAHLVAADVQGTLEPGARARLERLRQRRAALLAARH